MRSHDLKLGQMFLAGFDGMSVDRDHPVVKAIVKEYLGGVILFDRNVDGTRQNISSPAQLQKLTADLQHFADGTLIIAVDQEGGRVCRLKETDGFPATESAGKLAAGMDREQVFLQADIVARSLKKCGVNYNLAPVVDLNLNRENPIIAQYERSYGSDPEKVVGHAAQFIEAHHKNGVACCIKHFPGHGSAKADSHLGFVDITRCWQEVELEPFASLINAGLVDSVMTAHLVHSGMDGDSLPATLSPVMIQGMLRDKLGFDGVVISDDLQMKAITDRWSFEESVQKAVLAGVDLLIVGNNLVREENVVGRGISAVTDLIDSGRISEQSVRDSLNRVSTLRQKITGDIAWKRSRPIT